MRTTATPLNQREQVQPNTQKPGLNVVASPVGLGGTGANKVSEIDMMSSGINSFLQGASGYMERKEKDFREASARQAYDDFNADPNAPPSYSIEQTKEYQDTRLSLFAKRQAYTQSVEMAKQWNELKADPEKLRTTDIRKWTSSFVGEAIQGVDDQVLANTIQNDMQAKADQIMLEGMPILKELDNQARDQDMAATTMAYFKSMTADNTTANITDLRATFLAMGIPVDKVNNAIAQQAINVAKTTVDAKGNPVLGNDTAIKLMQDPEFVATLSPALYSSIANAGEQQATEFYKANKAKAEALSDADRTQWDYGISSMKQDGSIANLDFNAEIDKVYNNPNISPEEKSRRYAALLSAMNDVNSGKDKEEEDINIITIGVQGALASGISADKVAGAYLKHWNERLQGNGPTVVDFQSMAHQLGNDPGIMKKVFTGLGIMNSMEGTSPLDANGSLNKAYTTNIENFVAISGMGQGLQDVLWDKNEVAQLSYMSMKYQEHMLALGNKPEQLAKQLANDQKTYYELYSNGELAKHQAHISSANFAEQVAELMGNEVVSGSIFIANKDFDIEDKRNMAVLQQMARIYSLELSAAESAVKGSAATKLVEIMKKGKIGTFGAGLFNPSDSQLIPIAYGLGNGGVNITKQMELASEIAMSKHYKWLQKNNGGKGEFDLDPAKMVPKYVHSYDPQQQGYNFYYNQDGMAPVLVRNEDGTPLLATGNKISVAYAFKKGQMDKDTTSPWVAGLGLAYAGARVAVPAMAAAGVTGGALAVPAAVVGGTIAGVYGIVKGVESAMETEKQKRDRRTKEFKDKVDKYDKLSVMFNIPPENIKAYPDNARISRIPSNTGQVMPNTTKATYVKMFAQKNDYDLATAVDVEGLRTTVYKDNHIDSNGKPTGKFGYAIGIGFNMERNKKTALKDLQQAGISEENAIKLTKGDTSVQITAEQAVALYRAVVDGYDGRQGYKQAVNEELAKVNPDLSLEKLPPNIQAGLIRLAYNRGPAAVDNKKVYANVGKLLTDPNINLFKDAKTMSTDTYTMATALFTNPNLLGMLANGKTPL